MSIFKSDPHSSFNVSQFESKKSLDFFLYRGKILSNYHALSDFRAAEVGWLEAIDGPAGLGEGARGVFANVLGAQYEEDRKESAPGHDHFPWEV